MSKKIPLRQRRSEHRERLLKLITTKVKNTMYRLIDLPELTEESAAPVMIELAKDIVKCEPNVRAEIARLISWFLDRLADELERDSTLNKDALKLLVTKWLREYGNVSG